jgi:ABC-type transport system substrate-binding protein
VEKGYHPAMRRRGIVLAMAIAGTLAACSSSGDADPAPTTDPSTTVAVSEPEPTTTTAAPTTTVAPTTTLDPAESLAAEVEADLLEADRLENEASKEPFDSEKERVALERRVGFAAEALRSKLEDYRRRNVAIRENPEVAPVVAIEVQAELAPAAGDVAEVQVCEVNSWILVEVGAGPNGTDAVVNSDVVASRGIVILRRVDDVWRVEGGRQIGEWAGASECPLD